MVKASQTRNQPVPKELDWIQLWRPSGQEEYKDPKSGVQPFFKIHIFFETMNAERVHAQQYLDQSI
jgi:hypothetical protein